MIVTLQHRFWFGNTPAQGIWAKKVFQNVESLEQLETNLEKLAFPKNLDDLFGHDPFGEILGDGWEGFCEILLNIYGIHPDIGITNIKVLPPGTKGCDFAGEGIDRKPGTVQSKYKGKSKAWNIELSEGPDMKLERFLAQSQNEFGVDVSSKTNMLVITNAVGINYWTADELLFGKVRCLGRDQIKYLVNNNPAFWAMARTMIVTTNPHITFG
jgi:hypothetical protein